MSACSETLFITEEPPGAVETRAATVDTLATEDRHRSDWQSVIDQKLIEWGRDPGQLAEDELIPPTRAAVARAVKIARDLRDREWPPPLRAVPDGDGGVVLERWAGPWSAAFEIDSQGGVQFVVSIDGKVTRRVGF
jgi:hypothetical protein